MHTHILTQWSWESGKSPFFGHPVSLWTHTHSPSHKMFLSLSLLFIQILMRARTLNALLRLHKLIPFHMNEKGEGGEIKG